MEIEIIWGKTSHSLYLPMFSADCREFQESCGFLFPQVPMGKNKKRMNSFPLHFTGTIARSYYVGNYLENWNENTEPLFELSQPSSAPWKLCLILSCSRIMPKFRKTTLETDLSLPLWPFLPGLLSTFLLFCLRCYRSGVWCHVLDSSMPCSLLWRTPACLWLQWLPEADHSPALWGQAGL